MTGVSERSQHISNLQYEGYKPRQAAIEAVAQLNHDVNIPARLRDIGIKEAHIDALAVAALAEVCIGGNPRDTHQEEIKALYR